MNIYLSSQIPPHCGLVVFSPKTFYLGFDLNRSEFSSINSGHIGRNSPHQGS